MNPILDNVVMTTTLSPFGRELRYWRKQRGFSQLELAAQAGTTSRHVSFLETGRSRPSSEMVERLSSQLAVPLRERNQLFEAAGLTAPYRGEAIEESPLEPFRFAMDSMLHQHLPYPGMVVDRTWNIVRANASAQQMISDAEGTNMVRLMYGGAWREMIENWDHVAWAGIRRIRDDVARHPEDPVLAELLEFATEAIADVPRPRGSGSDLILCPRFRFGDLVVPTITVVAQFGSPRDVTIDELRIELIYPEDDVGRRVFAELASR